MRFEKKLSECSTERLMWARAFSLVRRNHEPRGDSRPRLSGGATLCQVWLSATSCRAALDWSAGGGCPHLVCAAYRVLTTTRLLPRSDGPAQDDNQLHSR